MKDFLMAAKRTLSMLLALALCLMMTPAGASAKETDDDEIVRALYALIESGIRSQTGIDYAWNGASVAPGDYIDFSSLALADTDGNKDLVRKAFDGVFFDHPEFFYMHQNFGWYRKKGMLTGIVPMYHEFAKEPGAIDACRAELNEAVRAALRQTDGSDDPAARLLILYEHLAAGNVYNPEAAMGTQETNQHWPWSAYGALVKGDTVCKGLAMAYKLLIDQLDDPRLECIVVSSKAMDHVWNMVSIDGEWYHLDVNKAINSVPTIQGISRHPSFLISDETAIANGYHGWEDTMRWETPVCSSRRYETGLAIQDVSLPISQLNGLCYMVKKTGYRKYALFSSRPDGSGETRLSSVPIMTREFTQSDGSRYFNLRSGLVWSGSVMYYVDESLNLVAHSAADGWMIPLGSVPFTPEPSEDGHYPASADGVSLSMDRENAEIVAVSRTTRKTLGRYPAHIPTLPSDLLTIEEEAFAGVDIGGVVIPDGCTAIGKRAFADNESLLAVYMPDSVTGIAQDAFEGSGKVRFICESENSAAGYAEKHGIPYTIQ